MKKTYITPDMNTSRLDGEELLGASLEVNENETITSSDEIEANAYSVWDEDIRRNRNVFDDEEE